MDRQIFHCTTGLRAANLHAPAIIDEAFHHVGCKGERRMSPQVFVVIRTFHFFDIVETAYRYGVRTIRQASKHARHHQADIPRVVGVAEGLPLDVLGALEIVADIFDSRHLFHRLFEEEFRPRRANKWHVRGGGDF